MKKQTQKSKSSINKSKSSINKTKKKLVKTCFTDQQLKLICKGQFDTLGGKIFTEENLKILNSLSPTAKDPEQYKKYLVRRFNQISNKKDLNYSTKLTKNDFYTFVNKEWQDSILSKQQNTYFVQYDNFRIVQDKVYHKLIDYTTAFIKENPTSKKAIAIKNVYNSIQLNPSRHLPILKQNCSIVLNEIDDFIEKDNMYGLLAYINMNEVVSWGSPIVWGMAPDEKNVKKYITHLSLPILSLADYTMFVQGDPKDSKETIEFKAMVKRKFLKYVKEVFRVCGHDVNPNDIWDIEYDMLITMGCEVFKNKKDDPNGYNVVHLDEIEKEYGFDLKQFAHKLGYKTVPKKIIVSSTNGFKCMVTLLKDNWNTPKWKTYWLYLHYRQMIRFIPALHHVHFDFYGKIVEGRPVQVPDDIYSVFLLSLTFNTFLSEQYLAHNRNPLYEEYVLGIVNDLKYIFIQKLKRNKWLSPKTRDYAILKLNKLEIFVGTPGKLREDPILNYRAEDSWYNVMLVVKYKHNLAIHLEGQGMVDIPTYDWNAFKIIGTQDYMVNAYYRPTSNSIYVPCAYLQKPFIDLNERGIEYNLAYIGYTIGHELSHSLDDLGSRYDADGNLNNWWSDRDHKLFQHKIHDVIKQYEAFAKKDGIKFDASFSVGEDLADISGLALVEEYLLNFCKINHTSDRFIKMRLEKLYTSYAFQGRQKILRKAISSQLRINPHPLEKYRANCPLSRLELFRTIFNTDKNDGMWWHNNDTIW